MGLDFTGLESVLETTFAKKPQVVATNVEAAKAGYEYAAAHFKPLSRQLKKTNQKWALVMGNELFAMGATFAGCKFYCAYPMSPATHILEWFAAHGKELGICVRQVEDETSVINMTIGASHMGVRSMCATSGGGFALMSEAIGMAGMIETPVVVINVMRAGPSTGVPTKTEQADLNQALGASQGDFPRVIIAPISMPDCFATMPLAFNVADRFQCPVIILADLLMTEGNETVDPSLLDIDMDIDRGELITHHPSPPLEDGGHEGVNGVPYLRYKDTESGISPRAIPGLPGHLYVSGTDEHDEDGVLLSDVYTDTVRRKKMVDKRARKMSRLLDQLPAPKLEGPAKAEVTLVGWGSTWGVITEAVERLNQERHIDQSPPVQVPRTLTRGESPGKSWARANGSSSSRTTRAASLPATCEPRQVLPPTLTSASTTASRLSPSTSWRASRKSSAAKKSSRFSQRNPVGKRSIPRGTSGDWEGRMVAVAAGSREHVH